MRGPVLLCSNLACDVGAEKRSPHGRLIGTPNIAYASGLEHSESYISRASPSRVAPPQSAAIAEAGSGDRCACPPQSRADAPHQSP